MTIISADKNMLTYKVCTFIEKAVAAYDEGRERSHTIFLCPEIVIRTFIAAVLYVCSDMIIPKRVGILSQFVHKVAVACLVG